MHFPGSTPIKKGDFFVWCLTREQSGTINLRSSNIVILTPIIRHYVPSTQYVLDTAANRDLNHAVRSWSHLTAFAGSRCGLSASWSGFWLADVLEVGGIIPWRWVGGSFTFHCILRKCVECQSGSKKIFTPSCLYVSTDLVFVLLELDLLIQLDSQAYLVLLPHLLWGGNLPLQGCLCFWSCF